MPPFGIGTVTGEDVNENNSGACIYYPLKTGAEWKLEGIGTSPTMSFKVSGTEKIENMLYFKIECNLAVGDSSVQKNIFYARCENNCVYWLSPPREEKLIFDFNTTDIIDSVVLDLSPRTNWVGTVGFTQPYPSIMNVRLRSL